VRTIQRSTHSRCEFGILKTRQIRTFGLREQRVLPPQAECEAWFWQTRGGRGHIESANTLLRGGRPASHSETANDSRALISTFVIINGLQSE
jgi:hypothetical protein